MPESDLALLIRAARAAGEVARGFVGGDLGIIEKPDGQGPVTKADLAVNTELAGILRGARPDYGWLSEESPDDTDRLSAERVFIVDPIDGTRSFIDGHDIWAHSLAVAERGEIIAAAVFLPMKDSLFAAERGGGATRNGAPIRASDQTDLNGADVLIARPALEPRFWPDGVPSLRRHYRPSLAYRLCLVADGSFDAMVTFRKTWEWDIAAGSLICAEAGARVTDAQDGTLVFNSPAAQVDGVKAAHGLV